jgi:hypothetical protein
MPEHVINLDVAPYLPDGWKVEEHQRGGQFKWDASKIALRLYKDHSAGGSFSKKLREKLKGRPVYNANLLDYLLKNPHLIPEEWRGRDVFFFGTIYSVRNDFQADDVLVRYLLWEELDGKWTWDFGVLVRGGTPQNSEGPCSPQNSEGPYTECLYVAERCELTILTIAPRR